jgi:hypothetical protein
MIQFFAFSQSLLYYSRLWSSYDRIWFSGPDKQETLLLILIQQNWTLLYSTDASQ